MAKVIRFGVVLILAVVGYWLQSQEKKNDNPGNQDTTNQTQTIDRKEADRQADWTGKKKTNTAKKKLPTFEPKTAPKSSSRIPSNSGARIKKLFNANKSKVVVEVEGVVKFTLPDDNVGHRHQQWVMVFENGHTVKVAHNIDLAPKVPLRKGDHLEMRGQYEWAEKGGVIHWTHHDPGGRRPGGWIRHEGKMYK